MCWPVQSLSKNGRDQFRGYEWNEMWEIACLVREGHLLWMGELVTTPRRSRPSAQPSGRYDGGSFVKRRFGDGESNSRCKKLSKDIGGLQGDVEM